MMVDARERYKRQNNWLKENTERISFVMPKGYKEAIRGASIELGISSSQFIRSAIEEKLSRLGRSVSS